MEEVSELQLRRSMTERKLETASKSEEEKFSRLHGQIADLTSKLHKLQNDYDTETAHLRIAVEQLENDKKLMDEKLKQTSKRFLSVDLTPRKPSVGGAGYHTDGQVDILRQVIASLQGEIVMVKGEQIRRDMEELLPPLRMPSKNVRDPTAERLNKLRRQEMTLETERMILIARTTVDLTKSKEERLRMVKERRTLDAELKLKMRKVRDLVKKSTC